MNSPFTTTKLLLILILLMTSLTFAQTSKPGILDPGVGEDPRGKVMLVPSDSDGRDTNSYAEAIVPGIGPIAPPFPEHGAAWPWLLLGLLAGWAVGAGLRRQRREVVHEEVVVHEDVDVHIPRDRAA